MKQLQKLAHGRHFGRTIAQTPLQTGILGQKANVIGTIVAKGLEQNHRLSHLPLREAALAFAELEIGGDGPRQAQGAEGPGDGQGPDERAAGLGQRARIQDKGCLG